ncbi:MAG: VanZ family protein [Lachnospira sp.]
MVQIDSIIIILALCVYIIIRKTLSEKTINIILKVGFPICVIGILVITIFSRQTQDKGRIDINLFRDFYCFFKSEWNLIGGNDFTWRRFFVRFRWLRCTYLNILLFIPFGMCLSSFDRIRKKRHVMVVGLAFSFFIETIQYITGRGTLQLDDLVFNTIGALCGYIVVNYLEKRVIHPGHLSSHNS